MTLEDLGNVVITGGILAGALLSIWALLHLMVVAPLKRWLRSQVRGPLIALERRVDDHLLNHPGPSTNVRPFPRAR